MTDAEQIRRVEEFLSTVHGANEMNVVRGLRKVLAGQESTFQHEVYLSVYGAPCGHQPPSHYPKGYGMCDTCRYGPDYDLDEEEAPVGE